MSNADTHSEANVSFLLEQVIGRFVVVIIVIVLGPGL